MNRIGSHGLWALILVVTALAFLPSLQGGFTGWDDDQYVTDNPLVRSWSGPALIRMFTLPYAQVYAPLTFASYALEYRVYGLKPFGYHAANLVLHLASAMLAFIVFLLIGRNRWIAGLTALCFAVHPLRVESVAWIAERKDVLYAFFYLAAIALYARQRDRPSTGSYAAILVLFILSLLSKPMAVTLPAALLVADLGLGRRIDRRRALALIPFFLLSALCLVMNFYAQRAAPAGLAEYLRHAAVGSYSMLFYLVKTILPINLSAFYPYPTGYPGRLPWSILAAPAALGLLVVLVIRFRRLRPLAFGGLWYLVVLFPVSQFIPLPGPAMTADRFSYLAVLGPMYAAACGIIALFRRTALRRLRAPLGIVCGAVIVTLAVATAQRCRVWHDGITLWNDVIDKYPQVAMAYDNRGILYAQIGRTEKALADFNRALAADPRLVKAYYNRGLLRYQTRDNEGALDDLDRAIAMNPRNPRFFNTRGIIHAVLGDNPHARADFDAAISLDPRFTEAYNNRGNTRRGSGDLPGAFEDFNRALAIDPLFADPYFNRAIVFFLQGNFDAGYADLKTYERLGGIVSPEFYRNLDQQLRKRPPN